MSLGIAFKGPEGIVLAADSRVTLLAQVPVQNPQATQSTQAMLVPATYDNATKLLRIESQPYLGVVTYGAGAIGQQQPRTAHSFLPEFEQHLAKQPGRRSVHQFAGELGQFFLQQWQAVTPPNYQGPDMVFLVGGFDEGASYGRVFEVLVPSRPEPWEFYQGEGEFGMAWGGQRAIPDRLMQGFDPAVIAKAKDYLQLSDEQAVGLDAHLRAQLQLPIPFQFLPLQDSVNLSIMLIRTTIALQTWTVDVRGVGGAIDVATITRTDGYRAVQQKQIMGEYSEYASEG